jgi:hypothetical protein
MSIIDGMAKINIESLSPQARRMLERLQNDPAAVITASQAQMYNSVINELLDASLITSGFIDGQVVYRLYK